MVTLVSTQGPFAETLKELIDLGNDASEVYETAFNFHF